MRIHTASCLLALATLLISCKSQKSAKEKGAEKNFFHGDQASLSLDSLKNEMATGETEFLRSFSDQKIAWQKWDKNLLQKSKSAQLPIFAFVGSAIGASSTQVAREIDASDTLSSLISQKAICTVIDTHVYPEIGNLCYHLSAEIKKNTAFPMLIWFTHEGFPLGWFPVGSASGIVLDRIINNSAALVKDAWSRDSRHSVENSRTNNKNRQDRFDLLPIEPTVELREDIFRRETRQIASLHSPGDQNIDSTGGLVPSSSLELLAIGSRSHLLSEEIRERCLKATQSVAAGLLGSAIKDQLNGSYFFARRGADWSMPAFSKTISSQARTASMLFKVGGILNDPRINTEALNLLQLIETEWLSKNVTSQTPIGDTNAPSSFLWDFSTLRKILDNEELALTKAAFSLKKSGNIPSSTDPRGEFYELNSLRDLIPISELSKKFSLTQEEINAKLNLIKKKLLAYRRTNTQFITERTPTVYDLSCVLKAQIARSCHSTDEKMIKIAEKHAARILKNYWIPGKGLNRIKIGSNTIAARGVDYMETSRAFLLLYQRTLNERWLIAAMDIMEHAIATLAQETNLLAETPPDERIIPVRQHTVSMIFGESTLGVADLVAGRLYAISGDKQFRALSNEQLKMTAPMLRFSTLNRTDFVASCVHGEHHLVAILQGDPNTPTGKSLLSLLNDPEYLSYLTIRAESGSDKLLPLPKIPPKAGEASVVLIRENQPLGQASSPEKLTELLDSILSGK